MHSHDMSSEHEDETGKDSINQLTSISPAIKRQPIASTNQIGNNSEWFGWFGHLYIASPTIEINKQGNISSCGILTLLKQP